MKKYILYSLALITLAFSSVGCDKSLEKTPIDWFGSGNFWKTEAQVATYVEGIHFQLRNTYGIHTIVWGEQRSGIYRSGSATDGSSVNNDAIILQNLSSGSPGVNNFGGLWGLMLNINLMIQEVEKAEYVSNERKTIYLGIAYGLRAYLYFDLHKMYGGVPLRLTPDVVNGVVDPNKLYLGQATPIEMRAQIEKDIQTSLTHFGGQTNINIFDASGQKGYWSKAATEAVAADYFMWKAKVTSKWAAKDVVTLSSDPSVGAAVAEPAAIATAKQHLKNLEAGYGLSLAEQFEYNFDAAPAAKGGSEVIFAMRFLEGEKDNKPYNGAYVYSMSVGLIKDLFDAEGNVFDDKLNLKNTGWQRYEYKTQVLENYALNDKRRDKSIVGVYSKGGAATGKLVGTVVNKNIGLINTTNDRVYVGDYIIYRLAWVYLSLAEVANFEGNNGEVEKYMNLVRTRAGVAPYVAGSYTQNELAILNEKTKEFLQEGQRWADLIRMTETKGGTQLVFVPAAGIDGVAVLQTNEAHKVLWPVDVGTLGSDHLLRQTPGYAL